MFSFYVENAYSAPIKAENFAVYDLEANRHIFHRLIDSLPQDGLIILNFTSVYCPPCKLEIPELKTIADNNKRLKLVCIYAETPDIAVKNASSLNISNYAYVDPFGSIRKLYNVTRFPVTFIIDRNYRILGRYEGYLPDNIRKIKGFCE